MRRYLPELNLWQSYSRRRLRYELLWWKDVFASRGQTQNWIDSFKAKQRLLNLFGLALGLGVFLVIAVIATQDQVTLCKYDIVTFDDRHTRPGRKFLTFYERKPKQTPQLLPWLIWSLKGEPSGGSILTGEIFMRADNPADCNNQTLHTTIIINRCYLW